MEFFFFVGAAVFVDGTAINPFGVLFLPFDPLP
jgi:hypothetical protein